MQSWMNICTVTARPVSYQSAAFTSAGPQKNHFFSLYIYIYIWRKKYIVLTGDDAICTPIHISHTPSLNVFWKCIIFTLWATPPVPLLTSLFENTVTVKNKTFNKYRFHGHADICKQCFCVSNLQKFSDLCSACPNIHSDETAWLPARWSSKYQLACFLFSFHRFAASIFNSSTKNSRPGFTAALIFHVDYTLDTSDWS